VRGKEPQGPLAISSRLVSDSLGLDSVSVELLITGNRYMVVHDAKAMHRFLMVHTFLFFLRAYYTCKDLPYGPHSASSTWKTRP